MFVPLEEGVLSQSNKNITIEPETATDKSRRDFLRKSAYAAYTAPIITALLVNKASAATSWGTRPPGPGVNPPPPPPPPPAG